MDDIKLKPGDIDVYGITVGPGLFTGIRVGISTLKGLVVEREKPVIPVITLEALAHKCFDSNFTIIPLIDAKRDEVYMAGYNFFEKEVNEIISPDLIHVKELKTRIDKIGDFCFMGSGADVHKDLIKKNFGNKRIIHRSNFLASEICKIAYFRYLKNNFIDDINQIFPFYIRKPDAEKNIL